MQHHADSLCSLDPPEMSTNQLLLVSSVGLGVNLFGMFAMGGHHHHVSNSFTTYVVFGLTHTVALSRVVAVTRIRMVIHIHSTYSEVVTPTTPRTLTTIATIIRIPILPSISTRFQHFMCPRIQPVTTMDITPTPRIVDLINPHILIPIPIHPLMNTRDILILPMLDCS